MSEYDVAKLKEASEAIQISVEAFRQVNYENLKSFEDKVLYRMLSKPLSCFKGIEVFPDHSKERANDN